MGMQRSIWQLRLATLRARVTGASVLVVGDAGVGKSVLVRRWLERAEVTALEVACTVETHLPTLLARVDFEAWVVQRHIPNGDVRDTATVCIVVDDVDRLEPEEQAALWKVASTPIPKRLWVLVGTSPLVHIDDPRAVIHVPALAEREALRRSSVESVRVLDPDTRALVHLVAACGSEDALAFDVAAEVLQLSEPELTTCVARAESLALVRSRRRDGRRVCGSYDAASRAAIRASLGDHVVHAYAKAVTDTMSRREAPMFELTRRLRDSGVSTRDEHTMPTERPKRDSFGELAGDMPTSRLRTQNER